NWLIGSAAVVLLSWSAASFLLFWKPGPSAEERGVARFREGTTAYTARDFAKAEAAFREAGGRGPALGEGPPTRRAPTQKRPRPPARPRQKTPPPRGEPEKSPSWHWRGPAAPRPPASTARTPPTPSAKPSTPWPASPAPASRTTCASTPPASLKRRSPCARPS